MKAGVPAATARCACRQAGAGQRPPPRATRPAATWAAAASAPSSAAAHAGASDWAWPANEPIGQEPVSAQAGSGGAGVSTPSRFSSAPAPSDIRGPVPGARLARPRGQRPAVCARPLPGRPGQGGELPRTGAVPAGSRPSPPPPRTSPDNHRPQSTRGSRRARCLRSLESNRPRANPGQGLGRHRSGAWPGGDFARPGSPLNQVCAAGTRIRPQGVPRETRRKPARPRPCAHEPVYLPAAIVNCRTLAKTA